MCQLKGDHCLNGLPHIGRVFLRINGITKFTVYAHIMNAIRCLFFQSISGVDLLCGGIYQRRKHKWVGRKDWLGHKPKNRCLYRWILVTVCFESYAIHSYETYVESGGISWSWKFQVHFRASTSSGALLRSLFLSAEKKIFSLSLIAFTGVLLDCEPKLQYCV